MFNHVKINIVKKFNILKLAIIWRRFLDVHKIGLV